MNVSSCSRLSVDRTCVADTLGANWNNMCKGVLTPMWAPATFASLICFADSHCNAHANCEGISEGGCLVFTGRGWTAACATTSLQILLSGQDAVLGPHVPGRDPLLDALSTFVGTPGSPALRPWEQGLPNTTDPAGQLAGNSNLLMPQHTEWDFSMP